ncbi:polysaccharide export protein [Novosphingobium sp. NBM11]|uniref:polysaccharide biosynthesis/export family protein n=1 Tax=Novosphingobium sp. NBM11 TaxID=2596914 RepID=UPI0018923246|nr:polysaccharide biosynthesis/export family protein [Novosphingobium sp. NBM11]MBF5090881.1 polysaccharide export protein [Novosphingobium sp. NBM11]
MIALSKLSSRTVVAATLSLALSGCATLPAAGPSSRGVSRAAGAPSAAGAGIKIVDVTDAVTRNILAQKREALFSETLGEGQPIGAVVGKGDVLDIGIWEAPPAALFGAAGGNAQLTSSGSTARGTSLPEQMVDSDGQITIPFVGRVAADGRTPQEIAREITRRLIGKAHEPQAIVRLVRNAAANVTVIGDGVGSTRVPLTARGERVLDVLAVAGGVKQPVSKITIQISRDAKVSSLPLDTVISDPRQNVRLRPEDVLTVRYQPYSFTALGAVGRNEEVPFEATGLTLAQALGRIAGLQDARADVKGLFIFRMEDPAALSPEERASAKTTPDGKVPVIYRVNLKDPATFFTAQSFPIRDKDVLYVSNAPLADIQKFLNVIFSTVLPAATTAAVISRN